MYMFVYENPRQVHYEKGHLSVAVCLVSERYRFRLQWCLEIKKQLARIVVASILATCVDETAHTRVGNKHQEAFAFAYICMYIHASMYL